MVSVSGRLGPEAALARIKVHIGLETDRVRFDSGPRRRSAGRRDMSRRRRHFTGLLLINDLAC